MLPNKLLNPKQYIKDLENMINDLMFELALRDCDMSIINKGYRLIGTPLNMEEMRVAIIYTHGEYKNV